MPSSHWASCLAVITLILFTISFSFLSLDMFFPACQLSYVFKKNFVKFYPEYQILGNERCLRLSYPTTLLESHLSDPLLKDIMLNVTLHYDSKDLLYCIHVILGALTNLRLKAHTNLANGRILKLYV